MGNVPMPKQFLLLNEKPILIHTVENFILNPRIKEIIIATPKDWVNYTEDILKKYNIQSSRVVIVTGGAERNETIMNVIQYIEEVHGLQEDDVLVTHDA